MIVLLIVMSILREVAALASITGFITFIIVAGALVAGA